VRIRSVGEFLQGQGQIDADRQAEFGVAHGGNHYRPVADAARDQFPVDLQFRVQPMNRQWAVVWILNVELDRKILLQQIPATQLNTDDSDGRPVEFWRD
jgi:hypothetical protein